MGRNVEIHCLAYALTQKHRVRSSRAHRWDGDAQNLQKAIRTSIGKIDATLSLT